LPKIKCPYLPIYERTSLLGKVVILAVLEENLINTKPTDFLIISTLPKFQILSKYHNFFGTLIFADTLE